MYGVLTGSNVMKHLLLCFLIALTITAIAITGAGATNTFSDIRIGESFETIQQRYGKNGSIDGEGDGWFTYYLSDKQLIITFNKQKNVESWKRRGESPQITIKGLRIDRLGVNPHRFRASTLFKDPANQIGQETRDGIKLVAYKDKYEEREINGKKEKVNVSEYVMEYRGRKMILLHSKDIQYNEYLVRFYHLPTGAKVIKSNGQTIEADGNQYTLANIDMKAETCTIIDQNTGEEIVLKKTDKALTQPKATKKKMNEGEM